ncbi:MAG: aldo/keto reductase [Pseudomonadales bacterium]
MHLPPLIIGTMARRGDDAGVRSAIYRGALDLGLRCFDTAPLYGFGEADRLLAAAIRDQPRDSIQILSKTGLRWQDGARGDRLFTFTDAAGLQRQVRKDSRPEAVRQDVEDSLRRLGTDYLDLIQIHHPDERTPIAETMGELLALRAEGKVRQIGVSNFSEAQLAAAGHALGSVRLASHQFEFNLLQRPTSMRWLDASVSAGIAVLAYSPLAGGALTRALEPVLGPVAEAHGIAPGMVPLCWVMGHPGVTSAITGVSSTAQLEAQAAASAVRLSEAERQALTEAFRGLQIEASRPALTTRLRRRARTVAGAGLRAAGLSPSRLRRWLGMRRW